MFSSQHGIRPYGRLLLLFLAALVASLSAGVRAQKTPYSPANLDGSSSRDELDPDPARYIVVYESEDQVGHYFEHLKKRRGGGHFTPLSESVHRYFVVIMISLSIIYPTLSFCRAIRGVSSKFATLSFLSVVRSFETSRTTPSSSVFPSLFPSSW